VVNIWLSRSSGAVDVELQYEGKVRRELPLGTVISAEFKDIKKDLKKQLK